MRNRITIFLTVIIFAFFNCQKEEFTSIPSNKRPVFKQGDIIIYMDSTMNRDTFSVAQLGYGSIHEDSAPFSYQTLSYLIHSKGTSTEDSTKLNKIYFERAMNRWYFLLRLDKFVIDDLKPDIIYSQFAIHGKNYTSVRYYSLKESGTIYRNLYFNYMYCVISVEVNGNNKYLSEIKSP